MCPPSIPKDKENSYYVCNRKPGDGLMDGLDTYGVVQKLWGGCELARKATP